MKIITKNKVAYMNYDIIDKYIVGIVLQWHEVKSIKWWHCNIRDAIVTVENRDILINNMDIPLYAKANLRMVWWSYTPKGKRTLLATAIERTKIIAKTTKTGLTIVPLDVFIALNGRIKLTIWVGKLRKKIEKKHIIKERDIKREMDREIKIAKG